MYSLKLTAHTTNPTILSSLAWNAVRDALTRIGRVELIAYIESVKVTDKRITIKTNKPLVNSELSHHKEAIRTRTEEAFQTFGVPKTERRIVFL